MGRTRKRSFLRRHSLGLAAIGILSAWIVLYAVSDPKNHLGSFFGNAIADWSGVVVMVFATKHLYERGSSESRQPEPALLPPSLEALREHSLSIFLIVTGIGWAVLYSRLDSESKWGEVVGNIVSEWVQVFGLVILTKRLIEEHSKESGG
jgi:peptidoglycan/LPS O-acetylase OafA/YrhL